MNALMRYPGMGDRRLTGIRLLLDAQLFRPMLSGQSQTMMI
jgi:hypothetical protein